MKKKFKMLNSLYKRYEFSQTFCLAEFSQIPVIVKVEVLKPRLFFMNAKITYEVLYDNMFLDKFGITKQDLETYISNRFLPDFKRYINEEQF